jgi:hypothetical protein
MIRACWEVQQVSGLPSTRQDLPRELSNVELTLEETGAIREIEQQWIGDEVLYSGVRGDQTS